MNKRLVIELEEDFFYKLKEKALKEKITLKSLVSYILKTHIED